MIAKRAISLSKIYLIAGTFLASISVLISSVSGMIGSLSITGIPNTASAGSSGIGNALPFVSVGLQVFAAFTFATPILLLYVYDKNNGVLEYFLSLGMNQGDVYRRYLKAALILSSVVACFEIIVNLVDGLIEGSSGLALLELSALVVLLALPIVSFGTLIMMSFSSLQKQRVGSNQPLGMVVGVFMVMPAYIGPLVLPSFALEIDLLLAAVIAVLSVSMYFLSSRLIRREKLLP